MKVLVACEYSGVVRDAFIKEGHDAISCDFLQTAGVIVFTSYRHHLTGGS